VKPYYWGFCCWQPVLVYGKDPYLQEGAGRRPDALVATETAEKNGHPCPKPIGVWKWLMQRVSPHENETIIDPFCGSGTTLRAAKDLGHPAIGIEVDRKRMQKSPPSVFHRKSLSSGSDIGEILED
jgi:DNA modification methylase